MSNLDNSLFESVCALLGIDKKSVEEYLKDPMSNMTCDVVKEAPVETPAIDHGDLPNRMNPEGKSDNQLKAEGWNLVENFEKRDDGAYVCKRVWTKSENPGDCKCECNCQEGQPDISDVRLKSDLLAVDGWMDVMNWALLHNWNTMKIAMNEKFPNNKDEVESVLKFVNMALEGTVEDQIPVTSIWDRFSSKNAYTCAEVLDHIIRDIVESIKENETNIVTDMNKLCLEARNMLISRLTKYKSLLDSEMDMIIDYTDNIKPQYHHMNIMIPYIESSPYAMILLWVSLITEYLAELIEITNKILSANKVL